VGSNLRALGRCGHKSLLPEIAQQAHVFAVGCRGSSVAQPVGRELDPIADGNDVVGIERAGYQSLGVKIAKRLKDGIEDFARFFPIERRPAECGGERIVGSFEDGVTDGFAAVLGTPAIQQFD
jgi:hypothetical protein